MVYCGLSEHAWRLRGVGIEAVTLDDLHAVVLPAFLGILVIVVGHKAHTSYLSLPPG